MIVTGAVPLKPLRKSLTSISLPTCCQDTGPVVDSQPVTVPLNVNVLEVVSLPSTGVTLSVVLIFGVSGTGTPAPVQYTL